MDVWSAGIDDKPGGLAKVLSGLRDAGADLDFVIARRAPDKPGNGVVFVTPLRGDAEIACGHYAGLQCHQKHKVGAGRGREQAGSWLQS